MDIYSFATESTPTANSYVSRTRSSEYHELNKSLTSTPSQQRAPLRQTVMCHELDDLNITNSTSDLKIAKNNSESLTSTPSQQRVHLRQTLVCYETSQYSVKRALYSVKRAPYSVKRAEYSVKRALYSAKRAKYSVQVCTALHITVCTALSALHHTTTHLQHAATHWLMRHKFYYWKITN